MKGSSIGSNDLTQLTLAVDPDSGGPIAKAFDERDPAVKKMLGFAINACVAQEKYVGICGQGPSDHPDLAAWLVARGVTSLLLNPDFVIDLAFAGTAESGERDNGRLGRVVIEATAPTAPDARVHHRRCAGAGVASANLWIACGMIVCALAAGALPLAKRVSQADVKA